MKTIQIKTTDGSLKSINVTDEMLINEPALQAAIARIEAKSMDQPDYGNSYDRSPSHDKTFDKEPGHDRSHGKSL